MLWNKEKLKTTSTNNKNVNGNLKSSCPINCNIVLFTIAPNLFKNCLLLSI